MIETVTKHTHAGAERHDIIANNLKMSAGSWIIIEQPTPDELDILAESLKLNRGNLDDVMDADEAPRLDYDAHHGYLYVRCPHAHADGSTTTRPLLIIYGSEDLITIFPTKPDYLDSLLAETSDFSTRSPQITMLKFLKFIFDDYNSYIKGQSQTIKSIITKMRHHHLENEDLVRFVLIEDQINSFLSALTPTMPLLRRLAASKHLTLADGERDLLEDIVLTVEQSINICTTNAKRIVSIREAYATLSNNSLNRTMKALTAATLLIALPNVVFGMYGMNINLPIQNQSWAFIVIIVGTITAVTAIFLLAKKRHWF